MKFLFEMIDRLNISIIFDILLVLLNVKIQFNY